MTHGETRIGAPAALRLPGPTLELTSSADQVVPLYGTVVIGRAEECELCFDFAFISARHACLAPKGSAYSLTDLGSTNGTFVNGRRLVAQQPMLLLDGDLICLDAPTSPDSIRIVYRTGILGQPTRTHLLDSGSLTIGRSDTDILLNHPQVSRQHARIDASQVGHTLIDLNSTNGTFVNNHAVNRTLLRLGDTIQIGMSQFVYQGSQLAEYDQRGTLRVEAQQLSYRVGGQSILEQISLTIEPRRLVAIVGASGAGKSTLLALLAGHTTPEQGRVLLGGMAITLSRAAIGFVPQDETLHRALPTERALTYTARLRLPPDTSEAEIGQRVGQALAEVGLIHRRAVPIGALSGGQRRRVAIAAELLADPALFILDEPTAGLDPGLERRLFATLRDLADSGRTVVVATHATASMALCDQVVFLSHGRLVYAGTPAAAPGFFGVQDLAEIYALLEGDPAQADTQTMRPLPQPPSDTAVPPSGSAFDPQPVAAPQISALRQLRVLTERAFELLQRDRRNLALLLAQAPAIGLLLALVARTDALVGERAAANEAKKVLFILATTAVWCGVINAARTIAGEWAVYRRERLAGVQIGPYVGSKVIALMPLLVAQALALLICVALKVQLPATGVFLPLALELFITTFSAGLTGTALGLLISAAATTPDRATSLVPLALIPQILFAGAIFSLGEGFSIQRALSWLTASRWAMDAFGSSVNINTLPLLPGMLRPLTPAAEYLATPGHLLTSWLALLAYTLVCLISVGVILRRSR